MPDEMLELHFIELDKMMKLGNFDESDALTRWVLFMNAESMQDMKTVAKQDPVICKTYSIVEEWSKNEKERLAYEAREAFLMDQAAREESAEERGRKEGRKEGRKKGREEGLIEAAKKFISRGMDKKAVCEMLGVSESDLI
jgi:predicted transposase/invertase (TIGR01784 family)